MRKEEARVDLTVSRTVSFTASRTWRGCVRKGVLDRVCRDRVLCCERVSFTASRTLSERVKERAMRGLCVVRECVVRESIVSGCVARGCVVRGLWVVIGYVSQHISRLEPCC